MTLKEATSTMLKRIIVEIYKENGFENVPDKEIAKNLELTPAAFSRLKTGVTTPRAATWLKIIETYKQKCGTDATENIIQQIE